MNIEKDGIAYNQCPLCRETMSADQNICECCQSQISEEMYKLKASFDNSYEFDIAVIEWLENQ